MPATGSAPSPASCRCSSWPSGSASRRSATGAAERRLRDNGGVTPALASGDVIPSGLAGAWQAAPAVVAAAALALALLAHAFLRLRRRGRTDHAPAWRGAAFLARP